MSSEESGSNIPPDPAFVLFVAFVVKNPEESPRTRRGRGGKVLLEWTEPRTTFRARTERRSCAAQRGSCEYVEPLQQLLR